MSFLSPVKYATLARKRRDAFRKTFESGEGETVLVDLMDYCGWNKDLFNENPITTAMLLGRRQVLLHIRAVMNATDEQLDRMIQKQQKIIEDFPNA